MSRQTGKLLTGLCADGKHVLDYRCLAQNGKESQVSGALSEETFEQLEI